MAYTFTTIIHREGRWFVARCAELGVVSQGKSIQDAQKNLMEAVELFLEDQPAVLKELPQEAPFITTFEFKRA